MKILIFGANGMVGQGVLRECLLDDAVHEVIVIGRKRLDRIGPQLTQIISDDVTALAPHADLLKDADACFFCLGVSSSGMSEQAYVQITQTLTLAVATQLVTWAPQMAFIYVSGAGTDSTEQGRSHWARVKGRTENELQKLRFARVCLFRPGVIQPLDGITSQTPGYRWFYKVFGPVLSLARWVLPHQVLTTRIIGRAMINAVGGKAQGVLESAAIAQLAQYRGRATAA